MSAIPLLSRPLSLIDTIAALPHTLRQGLHRRAIYRQTMAELDRLSDRDLADLGLHRTALPAIAREAAARG